LEAAVNDSRFAPLDRPAPECLDDLGRSTHRCRFDTAVRASGVVVAHGRRRYARAVSIAVRAGKAMDKVYLRMRHPRSFEVTSGAPGSFEMLRGHNYALMVTFRRNGTAVPTPTWFGVGSDGSVYVHTSADAGKVKRIRNNARTLLAPCNARGKPLGPAVEGRARVLPSEDWPHAETVVQANYGLGRRIYMLPARNDGETMAYLEIAPQSG
jgi:uncharacterized protein